MWVKSRKWQKKPQQTKPDRFYEGAKEATNDYWRLKQGPHPTENGSKALQNEPLPSKPAAPLLLKRAVKS